MSISIQLTVATVLLGFMVVVSMAFGAWSHQHPERHDLFGWGVGLAVAPGVVLLDRLVRRRWRALSTRQFPGI